MTSTDRDESGSLEEASGLADFVARALDGLRDITGQAITGWLSPAKNESEHTPDLLAENGVRYLCDWVNDDMPYNFRTASVDLTAMPLSTELEDFFVIGQNLHSPQSWQEQVSDACDLMQTKSSLGFVPALHASAPSTCCSSSQPWPGWR